MPIACKFKVGDTVTVKESYLNACSARPLKFNPGSKYKVTRLDNNPHSTNQAFYAECISADFDYMVGEEFLFHDYMPVYFHMEVV